MAKKPEQKMPISERAKQFMPFAAVKGLDKALLKVEQQLIPVPHADFEQQQKINDTLNLIKLGDNVAVTYLNDKKSASISGEITEIDYALKTLSINKTKILFEKLIQINFIK